jgi:hypothetical protein
MIRVRGIPIFWLVSSDTALCFAVPLFFIIISPFAISMLMRLSVVSYVASHWLPSR